MRCKTCEYPLWTIRARVCPECGDPFLPSDFEFASNAVQFCCPHCQQAYFGTGVKGFLEPPEFDCIKCANRIAMDDMVLVPREGIEERQTQVRRLPWTDKDRGPFSRFFATVEWGMGRPTDIGLALPASLTTSSALAFALLVALIGAGATTATILVFLAIMRFGSPGPPLVFFAIAVLGTLIVIALWSLLTHAIIRGGSAERQPIRRTAQVICLTSGPMILTAVPCLGIYGLQFAGLLWWIISAAIALRTLHECSRARAALATVIPPLIPIAAVLGWIVISIYGGINAAQQYSASYQATISNTRLMGVSMMSNAITMEVTQQGGYPRHAVEMLYRGSIQPAQLFLDSNPSAQQTATVNGRMLYAFTHDQRAVDNAIAALPPDVIAHRVGDYVFTWHGVTPAMSPDLWIAVCAPLPASQWSPPTPWYAIEADGDVDEVDAAQIPTELANQNRLRTLEGLPPLPPLDKIDPDNPATSTTP